MEPLLRSISCPQDLKKLNIEQLEALCGEIRMELIDTISRTGGHLASNLGVVELTVAMHRCFDCPTDTFVFDVGHQCYTHKLLTGRQGNFEQLRKKGGPAGFPKPSESSCDAFIAGHSGTALSSAIGLARAKQLRGDNSKTVVLIGDGSFVNGMVYEALNSLDSSLKNLIVVLNDNEMSISKSVGTLAEYLLYLRTDYKYNDFKRRTQKALNKIKVVGPWIAERLLRSKSAIRRSIYNGTLFEELGFNYVGPVDGHDLPDLCRIFENIKRMDGPILLHAITVKGKGFAPAEENPGAYHGVGKFDLEQGNPDITLADSFSNTFGRALCRAAERDERICAVTAAMKYATGTQYFAKKYPRRFFDVGIAEEHAVTFCGGLARGGENPVFAVYSTFLQRAYDQLVHDISLPNADLLLAIDRAGLVGDDGETHQGLFDAAMLSAIHGFTVASPANYAELNDWFDRLIVLHGPRAVRYPRGGNIDSLADYPSSGEAYDLVRGEGSAKLLLVTYGREFAEVRAAASALAAAGTGADILKLNLIVPIAEDAFRAAMDYAVILFAEEGVRSGGIAEHFLAGLAARGWQGRFRICAVENPIVPHATVAQQLQSLGLDAPSLAKAAGEALQ